MTLLTGIFKTYEDANRAVLALARLGYSNESISILAQEEVLKNVDFNRVDEFAGQGAGIGGIMGLVAGAIPFVIPGIGPLIGAGALLTTALSGAAVGAATGGFIGALQDWLGEESYAEKAQKYLKDGFILVTLETKQPDAKKAEQVLLEAGAHSTQQNSVREKAH